MAAGTTQGHSPPMIMIGTPLASMAAQGKGTLVFVSGQAPVASVGLQSEPAQ